MIRKAISKLKIPSVIRKITFDVSASPKLQKKIDTAAPAVNTERIIMSEGVGVSSKSDRKKIMAAIYSIKMNVAPQMKHGMRTSLKAT